jgi:DNA ligase-1
MGGVLLSGGRPRQLVPVRILRELAVEVSGLQPWLFEESYQSVGDLAETISLVLPRNLHSSEAGLAEWIEDKLLPLRVKPGVSRPPTARTVVAAGPAEPDAVHQIDHRQLSRRRVETVGHSRIGIDGRPRQQRVAQRLVGYTDLSNRPNAASYLKLIARIRRRTRSAWRSALPVFPRPCLVATGGGVRNLLGPASDWQVEWKWDGIRAQVVKREGRLWVWSRGEEPVTERFPEFDTLIHALPDGTVIDGEIVVWKSTHPSTEDAFDPQSTRASGATPCCSNASGAKPSTRRSSKKCRWWCSPTTCWSGRAKTGATVRRPNGVRNWSR